MDILMIILGIAFTVLCVAQDPNCNYYQELVMGQEYFINNINYPNNYTAGSTCKWVLKSVQGTKIMLSCNNVKMPTSPNCSGDKLVVSKTGNEIFSDGHNYCGKGSFSLQSQGTALAIGLYSLATSIGGSFICAVTAIRNPDSLRSLPKDSIETLAGCDCGWKKMTRIVGGVETGINEYPAMCAILYKNNMWCGSTIISNRYILTAGHCVYQKNPVDLLVLVGDHNISSGSDTQYSAIYRVSAYEIYPSYNPNLQIDDIAILQTTTQIVFSLQVGPICLPFRYTYQDFAGQLVTVLGWGQIEFSGPRSDTLQKAELTVISNLDCSQSQSETITAGEICSYAEGKDGCQSDSGGPLLWMDTGSQRLQLVGIISHGLGCASSSPGINTRVTNYLSWIVDRTSDASYCIK